MWRWIFLFFFPLSLSAQLKRFSFTENKMGSPFRVIFYHSDSAAAVASAKQCFALIDSLNHIFSDYDPGSEINRLNSGAGLPSAVSDELFKMIILSGNAWKKSNNTFDITMGQLTRLWRRKEKDFPSAGEIQEAKTNSGFKNVELCFSPPYVILKNNILFDFGGIVKGYAAQKVIDFLKTKNISSALADAGGDIAMSDPPPGKDGWSIAVNIPESENEPDSYRVWNKNLVLKNCAVATSGDMYRYTLHDGKKYSHIIDPRTGYGVISQRNVTVIAKDGATADWLATACSILPINKAKRLVKKEKASLFIALIKNEKIKTYKTKNFQRHFE
jgi:thiamine biosynthesis lipoprotein